MNININTLEAEPIITLKMLVIVILGRFGTNLFQVKLDHGVSKEHHNQVVHGNVEIMLMQ